MILLALSPIIAALLLAVLVVQRVGMGGLAAFTMFVRDAPLSPLERTLPLSYRLILYAFAAADAGLVFQIPISYAAATWIWLAALDCLVFAWRLTAAFQREGRA